MEQDAGEGFDLESLEFDFDFNAASDDEVIIRLAGDLLCPLCGSTYQQTETQFVRERESTLTLAVQCHCCGTGSLISVERALKTQMQAQLPMSELTPVERAFFAYLEPISEADVRRIRRLLRFHRGDLRDLI